MARGEALTLEGGVMQSIFRCDNALGLVLFFWLVCSPFQSAYPASPTSESAAMAPDQAMEKKILQHIQYGTPIVTEDTATAVVAEKASDKSPAKADVSDYPPEYGTGEIHVKLRAGWKLDRSDHVTRITKEGQLQYPEELLYLDYEFPESSIEPLWGPAEPLLELKARGERLSGQSLPDLSLWYSIKPDPTLPPVKMIGTEEIDSYRLPRFMEEATRRTIDILRTMPGVESVRVAAPMVRSSWPSMYANVNPDWTPFQLQTAPDVYYLDGDVDYGNHTLAVTDLMGGDYDLGVYPYQGLLCPQGSNQCSVGGLNVWPAWDAPSPFKGEGVAIGYIEEDWCLSPLNDGDFDNDYEVKCPTHPDLQAFHDSNHIKYLTSERTMHLFGYGHGTSVLGIMAADHNNAGSMGIAPNADYYIGYAWYTPEWIAIAQRIIGDGQSDGALFTEPPFGCFNGDSDRLAACPVEVHPEYLQFIRILTANNFVVVTIPGNGYGGLGLGNAAGVNLDKPVDIDGDVDGNDFDYDDDNYIDGVDGIDNYESFDYPDGFLDNEAYETGNNGYQSLDRAAATYIDSGSILVAAGTAQDWKNQFYPDTLNFSRRSRDTWSSYGSRVDVQARGSADISPIAVVIPDGDPDPDEEDEPITPPTNMYNYFSGTSACLPQITSLSALAQQMYKTLPLKTGGQAGDFLTSIRMRNVLVENGNPQAPLDVDPNWVHFPNELNGPFYNHSLSSDSFFKSGRVPLFLESPAEPFARIGPRPDLGKVMYAFGLADEAGNSTSYPIPRYKLSFENHQYAITQGQFYFFFPYSHMESRDLPVFIPNEPFSKNYIIPKIYNTTGTGGWKISLSRSPRVAGGFALKFDGTPSTNRAMGRYLQVQDTTGIDSSYFHANGSGTYDQAAFTLSAWINIAQQLSNNQYIFYKQTLISASPQIVEYGMYIDANMHLCFDHTMDGTTTKLTTCTTSTLTTNRVYHVAIVVSQSSGQTTVMPYINGAKARTSPALFAGTKLRYVDPLPETGLGFSGSIDEILFEKETFPTICGPYYYCYRNPTLEKRFSEGANPSGLLASWQFDVKNSTTISEPVSGYNGTLTDNGNFYSKWGAGMPIGNFYPINGITSSISVSEPTNSSLPGASTEQTFSIEAFFKAPDSITSTERVLVSRSSSSALSWKVSWKNDQIQLVVQNSNGMSITALSQNLTDSSWGGTIPAMTRSWIHLVITYDGVNSLASIYANGKNVSGSTTGQAPWGRPITLGSPVKIGSANGRNNEYDWNTSISFVRVYNTVLSSDNIRFLYDNRSSLWKNSYFKAVYTP